MTIERVLPVRSLIGMVHLPPLPGSPRWGGSMNAVIERARSDALTLAEGGMSGLIVENFGDVPFHPGPVPPATVAAMTVAVREVMQTVSVPVGVNMLRNDARSALAVAAATGAGFVRVNVHVGTMFTDQGILEGRAYETLRLRSALDPEVAIVADVFVKHGAPPAGVTLEAATHDTLERGLADVVVVSGTGTGRPVDPEDLARVRRAAPTARIWVGSGVTAESAPGFLAVADGLIVGTYLKKDGEVGKPVDPARVRALVASLSPG